MRIRQAWPLVRSAGAKWQEDRAQSMGAALSYYTLFSVAPLLLTLWLWWGMRRRGWPINRALLMIFLVIFIGFLPGLIGGIFNIPALSAWRIF